VNLDGKGVIQAQRTYKLIKRLMAVVICCSSICFAQQKTNELPDNYKTLLTESFVKVIRVHYGPHETVAAHDHPATPTVYVYLNNSGPVKLTHLEGNPFTVVRPPTHTGAYRVDAGRMERHTVENLSDLPSDFLRVELVGFQPGKSNIGFRGKAPEDLSHDVSATEFSAAGLTITRTVCVDATPCAVRSAPGKSVVVAFSGGVLHEGDATGRRTKLKFGDVLTLPADRGLSLSTIAHEPAHILVISVASAQPAL
jgi:hypothetical protein